MKEEDNDQSRNKDRSPSPGVKSTAVVKYTAFQSPVGYARLQCNTDLNLPPSNWGGIDPYGLKQILTRDSELSSFRIAHMFPDCVGEVDVISDAECIKKLLKLPYQPNGPVSMIVHRVENTLLLDDFDVYDYLMKSEWSWLKDFFYENIVKTMSEKERMKLMISPSPSSALQLTHKFLSHSVVKPPEPLPSGAPHTPMFLTGPFLPEPETRPEKPNEQNFNRNVLWTFEDIHMLIGSNLPIFGDEDRPCVSLRLRDVRDPINVLTGIDYWLDNLMCNVPEVLMCYHVDGIVQKYEPMKTEDLPNMENSKFSPKVIKNVAQNILSFLKSKATKSGHTYWLFKLPHDEVVKLYDLTSLCPGTMDNPFTTPVAMLLYRVARNMKLMNRSKHVRQLLEHVVQLLDVEKYPQIVASSHYMLADLYVPATTNPASPNFKDECSDEDESVFDNFSAEYPPYPSPDVDCSLEKDEDKMDVMNNSPEKEGTCERDEDNACGESASVDQEASTCGELAVQMQGLLLSDIGHKKASQCSAEETKRQVGKGLGTEPASRCGRALRHVLKGLKALHSFTTNKNMEEERERIKQERLKEEQHPKMANPFEPIKLNYKPLKTPKEHTSRSRRKKREKKSDKSNNYELASKSIQISKIDKNAILVRKERNHIPTLHEPNRDDNYAWKLHLKTLLYEKICLSYATLTEYSYSHEQYGFSLKYINMTSLCQMLLSNMIIKSRVVDASCLMGRVGDNFFQLSKRWSSVDKFRKQFETDHAIDTEISNEIEYDLVEETDDNIDDEFNITVCIPATDLDAMLSSCSMYGRAVLAAAVGDRAGELKRRRASVCNELAVRYMNDAQQIYMKYADEPDQEDANAKLLLEQFSDLSQRSARFLSEATAIFEQVKDTANLALLYCNKARYMRFKAHCDEGAFNAKKRSLYSQAEELYSAALKLVGLRSNCGNVRDLVCWELSCHLYSKAVLMQDYPGSYVDGVTEVADAFKHALKHCLLTPGPRQYLYQFRAAMIYHRLGSLYHAQYRACSEEGQRRRSLLSSTCSHYDRAALQFAALEDAAMYLTVRMEHVAALEAHALASPNLKLKSLQSAIELFRQCHSIMKLMKEKDPEEQREHQKEEEEEKGLQNEHSLLGLYENRLHHILKSVIQYCRSKCNKDYEKMSEMYKKLYCASLKIQKNEDVRMYAASICDVLHAMDDVYKEFG